MSNSVNGIIAGKRIDCDKNSNLPGKEQRMAKHGQVRFRHSLFMVKRQMVFAQAAGQAACQLIFTGSFLHADILLAIPIIISRYLAVVRLIKGGTAGGQHLLNPGSNGLIGCIYPGGSFSHAQFVP